MGGAIVKKESDPSTAEEKSVNLPLPGYSSSAFAKVKKSPLQSNTSLSEFNFNDLATNITHRFSVLSGLSFISYVAVQNTENCRRPWSRVSRKRWHTSTLKNEYAQCKTVWPVAQTEALFLPEFPVGIEERLKLILLGEIGRGAFGQVFHVKCSSTNNEYAMKVLSKAQVCSLDAVRQVKQEVMIQHMCSHHPFITPLKYFWQTRKLLIVMTEYIGYGELQQLWRSLRRLPEELVYLYVAELALALDFLHNAGIIYRDLKMENILLDANGHIKLIDFGLSRWLSYGSKTKTICGTLQFMAPEILNGEEYGHAADWWSLGIIAYSLLAGHYPVSGQDDHVTMKTAVDSCSYLPPHGSTKAMKSLLFGLLQRSPIERIHSLTMLQKEELFMKTDFDDIRERKMSPRVVLEDYIEGKSRHCFEDFQGLTSTPKKGVAFAEPPLLSPPSSLTTKPSKSPLMGGRAILWDRAKRSSSSPLLSSPLKHPARLGHHDALIKSVSVTGYNGAAVPLLQSPLLRLARGQTVGSRGRSQQKAVSINALPTAVSPLLVNFRDNRRNRFQGRDSPLIVPEFAKRGSISTQDASSLQVKGPTKRSFYRKSASSEDCVAHYTKGSSVVARRSSTESACQLPKSGQRIRVVSEDAYEKEIDDFGATDDVAQSSNPISNGSIHENSFFRDVVTSTPKRPTPSTSSQGDIPMSSSFQNRANSLKGRFLEVNQNNSPAVSISSHLNQRSIVNGDVVARNSSFIDSKQSNGSSSSSCLVNN